MVTKARFWHFRFMQKTINTLSVVCRLLLTPRLRCSRKIIAQLQLASFCINSTYMWRDEFLLHSWKFGLRGLKKNAKWAKTCKLQLALIGARTSILYYTTCHRVISFAAQLLQLFSSVHLNSEATIEPFPLRRVKNVDAGLTFEVRWCFSQLHWLLILYQISYKLCVDELSVTVGSCS